MPLLQVRDFPADIYEEISFEAKQQNRTIAQQTVVLIKKGLGEEISLKEKKAAFNRRNHEKRCPRSRQSNR